MPGSPLSPRQQAALIVLYLALSTIAYFFFGFWGVVVGAVLTLAVVARASRASPSRT